MQGQGHMGKGKGKDKDKGKDKGKDKDKAWQKDQYTLWVGNMPAGWSEQTFNNYFDQFGITWNNYLGGACGTSSTDQWGKVNYSDYDHANKALNETNGLQVEFPPGSPDAQVWKLTVRWYDGHRNDDSQFEDLTQDEQLEQATRYAKFGITGKKFNDGRWQYKTPRVPDYIRDMIGKGTNKEQMTQFLEAKGKGEGKGEGKGTK